MDIIVEQKTYTLSAPIAQGGEGEIFVLTPTSVAKVYKPNVLDQTRQLKVLALCNLYHGFIARFGEMACAFPRTPAHVGGFTVTDIAGFAMKYFNGCGTLADHGYDLRAAAFRAVGAGAPINDVDAVKVVYDAAQLVERLHSSRVILGDINPNNFLYDAASRSAIVIDIDAAQVGSFSCKSFSPEYLDPLVQSQGQTLSGGYSFSAESDWFSFACVMFEFLVGANPFFSRSTPPFSIEENIEARRSLIRTIVEGTKTINGVSLGNSPVDLNIIARLQSLRNAFPELFDYFVATFVRDERHSLMSTLTRDDPRHPAYVFFSTSGFDAVLADLVARRKKVTAAAKAHPLTIPDSGMATLLSTARPMPHTTFPDSGFASILGIVGQGRSGDVGRPTPQPKMDPPALSMFLGSHAIGVNSLP
ncbi:MAG: serine/threonine-protein kinase [Myxococcota bacterium]